MVYPKMIISTPDRRRDTEGVNCDGCEGSSGAQNSPSSSISTCLTSRLLSATGDCEILLSQADYRHWDCGDAAYTKNQIPNDQLCLPLAVDIRLAVACWYYREYLTLSEHRTVFECHSSSIHPVLDWNKNYHTVIF